MSDLALLRQSSNASYLDYVYRVDVLIDTLKAANQWNGVPHPWIDVFMPGETVENFVAETFAGFRFDDVGLAGFGLLFPIKRSTVTRP
jgi:cytokinin dehydrogenase